MPCGGAIGTGSIRLRAALALHHGGALQPPITNTWAPAHNTEKAVKNRQVKSCQWCCFL